VQDRKDLFDPDLQIFSREMAVQSLQWKCTEMAEAVPGLYIGGKGAAKWVHADRSISPSLSQPHTRDTHTLLTMHPPPVLPILLTLMSCIGRHSTLQQRVSIDSDPS
jgi:hypothetical protein